MAGATPGPDPIGAKVHLPIGDRRRDKVDAWAEARGKTRAEGIRALIDVGLDTCPTRLLGDAPRAELVRRRAELVSELAALDHQLQDDEAHARLAVSLSSYLWHRADYHLLQNNQQTPSEGTSDD